MTKNTRKRSARRFRWKRLLAGIVLLFLLLTLLPVLLFRWIPPPTTAFMLQHWVVAQLEADGLAAHPHYQWVSWSSISPAMRLAVVAAEDQKFPRHHGFDTDSIQDALGEYMRGGDLRGASTISQQVAKNLFLWPAQNWFRKGLEAWFTILIEFSWPKQRILEIYLNIAQFGPDVYGVEAASLVFFDRTAAMLTPRQAALLAAVLPSPTRYSVAQPSGYVLDRQNWILQQMDQLGGPAYLQSLNVSP